MAYSSQTQAEDVLPPCTLDLVLPASALELPAVREHLGLSEEQAAKVLGRLTRSTSGLGNNPKVAARLVRLTLREVAWEWDTERLDVFDEDGDEVSLEVRRGYSIDAHEAALLENMGRRVSKSLRALGIPHDIEHFDSLSMETTSTMIRLVEDPKSMGDYAWKVPTSSLLSRGGVRGVAQEALERARDSGSLDQFIEWLGRELDEGPSLEADCLRFDQLLANSERANFVEASARILSLFTQPANKWRYDVEPTWSPQVTEWTMASWEGEDPWARMARCGLPITMTKMERLIELGLELDVPCERVILAVLDAYLASHDDQDGRGSRGDVQPRTASMVGKCLTHLPGLAMRLSPKARSFFDAELAARNPKDIGEADYAEAEAHWLRAQSMVARKSPLAESTSRRLAL